MLFRLVFVALSALPFLSAAPQVADGAPSSAYATLDWKKVRDHDMGNNNDFHDYKKNSDPVRGVNLGGWLVLEPWINVDLFSTTHFPNGNIPVDEFNFVNTLGYSKAGEILEKHYSSWITERDFVDMKDYGLNAVRIPIGYWAWKLMATDKYYQGSQVAHLDKALEWAKLHGLHVWIDLHGAPGSQNGYDSSGHKYFHDWTGYDNIGQTKEVLEYIFAKYGGVTYKDIVIGIELVNEPLTSGQGSVTQDYLSGFYQDTIAKVRGDVESKQNIILHDGYLWQGAWSKESYTREAHIVYDTHMYMLFDETLKNKNYDQKIAQVCEWGDQLSKLDYKEVVGEFTSAWDADGNSIYTKTIDKWSEEDKAKMSRFVQAEFNAFERNYGWFFWSWRMGNSDQWDFRKLIDNGVIPKPVTKRTYNDCK